MLCQPTWHHWCWCIGTLHMSEVLASDLECQVCGSKLVVVCSALEVARAWKTRNMQDLRALLNEMEAQSIPDTTEIDCFGAAVLRTGDLLHIPAGAMVVEKSINDMDISLRQAPCRSACCHMVMGHMYSENGGRFGAENIINTLGLMCFFHCALRNLGTSGLQRVLVSCGILGL